MRVNEGVEEKIDRHPAAPPGNAEAGQRGVEVIAAVVVAGIADVIVVLGGAGHGKGVVAAHGVLHHFDQRGHILVVVLGMQAGHGVRVAHQGAGGGHVQRQLQTLIQFGLGEALEVGALLAVHIDDLDVLPGLHRVRLRAGALDQQVLQGLQTVKLLQRVRAGSRPLRGVQGACRERPVFNHACHRGSRSKKVARPRGALVDQAPKGSGANRFAWNHRARLSTGCGGAGPWFR